MINVLMVEDNLVDAGLLRELFQNQDRGDIDLSNAGTMAEAELIVRTGTIDAVLLDLGLPDSKGLASLNSLRAFAPRVPVVVLTGLNDEALAIQALQEGAQDYLIKGNMEARNIVRALRYAIERSNLEEALFLEKERAQITLASIGDGVISTDTAGKITFLNLVATHLTGWSSQEAQGHPLSDVFKILDLASREESSLPAGLPSGEQPLLHNRILVSRTGIDVAIDASLAPILDRVKHATGSVVIFRDVTAARALSLKLTYSAQHDGLTGLPNRALLNDRLNQAIAFARRHTKRVAVLVLDLDGFKHVNDSLGHLVGDRLLQSIASRLVDCGRASDTVSRVGGDEFVVLLSEMERSEDAAIAARRILAAVGKTHFVESNEVHVTTSIGVGVYPEDGMDAETLMKNADIAMYQAKESGRQTFRFFKPEMNLRAIERQSIEDRLRRALERDELLLHFQPKMNFRNGEIAGAEALLRWRQPGGELIPPLKFLPVAESCRLILPIGNWVLREACRQAKRWQAAGLPPVTMAVNVSALEFRDRKFCDGLFATLAQTGLDPGLLELELTESVLLTHSESAKTALRTIRQRGVKVALDDYGSGYSSLSLSYLRASPVDSIKIDRSFIAQITTAQSDVSIVTAILGMARNLNIRVIAEGVETLEQLAFLKTSDCNEAQGYYFSRAVPSQDFAELLRKGIPPTPGVPQRLG